MKNAFALFIILQLKNNEISRNDIRLTNPLGMALKILFFRKLFQGDSVLYFNYF